MTHTIRPLLFLPLFFLLSGCGVLLPYAYDSGELDERLSVSMPKEQVLKKLGRPHRIVQDDGRQAVWEYRLYPKGEWVGYLVHCPWHINCFFPAESASPYYVALQSGRLCMWGAPEVVRTLSWKVCGPERGARLSQPNAETTQGSFQVSVIPVFMPPAVATPIKRLAVVPLTGVTDDRFTAWLDLTLNFLRSRHPELILVEREDLQRVLEEVHMQYSGRVDDATMVRVGRLAGADTLLTYRLAVTEAGGQLSASCELRLIEVESGTTLFRQISSTTTGSSAGPAAAAWRYESGQLARRIVVEESAAYGLAALAAAFGDNPLGLVPDHTWPSEGVKLLGLLQGSPAYRAGLKQGDWILAVNGRPLRDWTGPFVPTSLLSVERDGNRLEFSVDVSGKG